MNPNTDNWGHFGGLVTGALLAWLADPVELEPGGCLLFNTRLLHRSGGNKTDRHRRVITLHMASTTCALTADALSEYAFNHVRGKLYDGCLAPVEDATLRLHDRPPIAR